MIYITSVYILFGLVSDYCLFLIDTCQLQNDVVCHLSPRLLWQAEESENLKIEGSGLKF